MGDRYDGRIDSWPKTTAQKQQTAAEMQKLLDASDVQANQAEREAIKDIKKEVFALKKETAQVTLHNVEALRNLTPAQIVTLIEANYKTDSGKWRIEKDDGLIVVKQLALDILGRYSGWVDNAWGTLSQRAEAEYRAEKHLPAQGATEKILQAFIDDIRAHISSSEMGMPWTQVDRWEGLLPEGVVKNSSSEEKVQKNIIIIGDNRIETTVPVEPSLALDPTSPVWENVVNTKAWMQDIQSLSKSLFTLPSNVKLKAPIQPVDTMPLSEILAKQLAKNYRKYAKNIQSVSDRFGIPSSIFANLLIKENPRMVEGKRTTIGQMDRAAWEAGARFAKSQGISVGSYDTYRGNAAEAIKAAAGLLAYHYKNCGDRFVAAQLYHAWSVLSSNERARYYAKYNPAIIDMYNRHIDGPNVTKNTITARQYNISAKLFYAVADYS